MTQRNKVLVTGAEEHQGLAVIRGLGLAGIPVVACGTSRYSLGFHSRFAIETYRYTSPLESPQRFLSDICEIVRRSRPALVIPAVESTLVVLNDARQRLERHTTLAAPAPEILEYAIDKAKTLELAMRLGVPVPRSVQGETLDEILASAATLAFPVAIKPRGHGLHSSTANTLGFKVRYARSLAELEGTLAPFRRDGRALLVQEYVPGTGRCVSAVCRRGEPLVLFAYAREREFPLSGGVSVLRRSIALDERLERYVAALLRAIGWHGVAMVEFKYDDRVERYTLMEINGRFQASTALSLDAGLNLPHLVACVYLDRDPRPVARYKIGVRERWLRGDLMALRDGLTPPRHTPHALVLWRFLWDFRPGIRYDEFKLFDWKPGLVECGALLGLLAAWATEAARAALRYVTRYLPAPASALTSSRTQRSIRE